MKSSNPAATPPRWDKTGVVVEVKPHEQLVVKVDGRRKLTQEICERAETSLEDQNLEPNSEPPPVPITGKRKRTSKIPPAKTPTP